MFEIIMLLGFLCAAVSPLLPAGGNESDQQKAKPGKRIATNHGTQKAATRRAKTINKRTQETFARTRPGHCHHEGRHAA